MKKRKAIVLSGTLILVALIAILGYFFLKSEKKQINLQANDFKCILVRKNGSEVNVTEQDKIEKIVQLLNELEYQQEHPYIRCFNQIKDGRPGKKKTYFVALYKEECEDYSFNDGWMRISLDRTGESIRINGVEYILKENGGLKYKEYFEQFFAGNKKNKISYEK